MNGCDGKRVTVKVATCSDDVITCLLIRAAVFVGEDGCLIHEEADGNDFGSTHVIGYVDGQPAGTMRIRYFGGFAVLERMAVLRQYRKHRYGSRGVAWEVGEFAFNFARIKGYTGFYGLARDGLVDFWKRFAPEGAEFSPIPGATLVAKGIVGHPMEGSAPPLSGAVSGMGRHDLLKKREADLPAAILERAEAQAA